MFDIMNLISFVLLCSYYKRIHKELTGEDYVSDYDGDDSLSTSDSSNDGKGS